jgi:hypothetical protein
MVINMKIESKISKFKKAGACVGSSHLNGYLNATFKNGVVVLFNESSQSIKYGYDEAIQESICRWFSTPAKAIESALSA